MPPKCIFSIERILPGMRKHNSVDPETGIMTSGVAYVFAAVMIGIFPLYFHEKYADIRDVKMQLFLIITVSFFLVTVLLAVTSIIENSVRQKHFCPPQRKFPVYILALTGLFAVSVVIALLLCDYRQDAFWGETGRRTGAAFWLLVILAFLMVGRYLKANMGLVWIFLISNTLVFLLALLNYWGLDPLGMHTGYDDVDRATFISTIGNVNMNVSYDCLVYPVGLALFYQSRERLSRILYGAFVVIGAWGIYSTTSEGWVLGVGGAFVLLLWFGMNSMDDFKHYCETAVLFLVALLSMQSLSTLAVHLGKMSASLSKSQYQIQDVTLMHPAVLGGILLIFAVCLVVSMGVLKGKFQGIKVENADLILKKIRKFVFVFFLAVVTAGICLLVAVNVNPAIAEEKTLLQRLVIGDDFGSGRGFVWRMTAEAWTQLPFSEKIFGYGPNCFRYMLEDIVGQELQQSPSGGGWADPHNEFLNILSMVGIAGVVGYFGLMLSYLVRCFRGVQKNPLLLLGVMAIGASLLQGLVNSSQVFSTPLLFILLGILETFFRKEKEPVLEPMPAMQQKKAVKKKGQKKGKHKSS